MDIRIKLANEIIKGLNEIKTEVNQNGSNVIYNTYNIFDKLEKLQSKYFEIMKASGYDDYDDYGYSDISLMFKNLVDIAEEDEPWRANQEYFSIDTFMKVLDNLIISIIDLSKTF